MVRLSECSSYQRFELSSDFYEKVLVKVQREFKSSSSYWGFELLELYCKFKVLRGLGKLPKRKLFSLAFWDVEQKESRFIKEILTFVKK